MPELTFTKHFEDNWQARVGGLPTIETVRHIIRTSARIQKSFHVRRDGEPYRVLAIYWHPELDLIIKLDPAANCAVTVMSRACWRYDGEPQAADKPGPLQNQRVPRPRIDGRREVIAMKRQKSREMTGRALRVAETFAENRRAAR